MTSYAFPALLKPSFAPFDELDFGLSSGLSLPFSKEDVSLSQALHTERVDPIRYQAVNHRGGSFDDDRVDGLMLQLLLV